MRWRLSDLCQWLWEAFQVSLARQTLGRELRALGYRKLSARPRHHAQAAGAIEHFKKPPRAARPPVAVGTVVLLNSILVDEFPTDDRTRSRYF